MSFCAVVLIYTHTHTHTHVVTGCGFFSWPWQWFTLQRADSHLFVTSNGCITVTDTLGWSAVVICACDIILLFSVLSRVITDVRKFRSYSYYKRNIWRPVFVTILRREVIEGLSFFGGIYMSVLISLTLTITHSVQIYTHTYANWFKTKKVIIFPTHWNCKFLRII